jgi:cation diffusion facilitator CzcD-associated flavoprotein CzcO
VTEQPEVIVVGGGQAGLAAGHYLTQAKIPFVILHADSRVGDFLAGSRTYPALVGSDRAGALGASDGEDRAIRRRGRPHGMAGLARCDARSHDTGALRSSLAPSADVRRGVWRVAAR